MKLVRCPRFDSCAPAHFDLSLGLPIYVARVPAAPFSLLPSSLYLDHSHGPVLAANYPSCVAVYRAMPDRDVFYVADPAQLHSRRELALRATGMHRPGVVALVIGGFGLAVLAIVVSSLREAAAMKCWPVAKGRVLSAKVEKYRQSVSRGTGGPRDRMTLYRPVLLYEYEVAGKRFRGSRIAQSPGLDRGVPEFAEKVVDRYPGGSAVAVRYNPRRPDESVLEPRVPRSWIFGAAIGVALLVLAAYTYHRGM